MNRFRLGKQPAKRDPRTLRLARYLQVLPVLPEVSSWTQEITAFGMMGNDILGDCTCATIGHAVQIWTAGSDAEITVADADVIALYESACGYKPGDPSTDQGGVLQDVISYVRKNGIGGHTIDAFVSVDPKNHDHLKFAIHAFGGAALGVEFLEGWEDAPAWKVGDGANVGGHAIWAVGYSPDGVQIITWGELRTIMWEAIDALCDEGFAILSPDWLMATGGPSPSAFDLATLQADLATVTA